MKKCYLFLGLGILYACSSTDQIKLPFPTVEKISVSSQRISAQQPYESSQSVIIEGIVSSNESQIKKMYLVWNDYFGTRISEFNTQNPWSYANKKEFQWQESGKFMVSDTTSSVIFFSIFVESSNRNSYSNVYMYESATKTLTKFR